MHNSVIQSKDTRKQILVARTTKQARIFQVEKIFNLEYNNNYHAGVAQG
jgi:hypothetical protein